MRVHAKAIRYFDTIRRTGSIRAAARQLHVDASAVNRQLLNLEKEAGLPLFDRLPGGLRLTQAGEIFSQHVIAILQDEQRTSIELAKLQGVKRGEVRLASVEGLTTDFLPNVLETLLRRHPEIHVHTYTHGSRQVGDLVLSGDADIGLAFSMPPHAELRCLSAGQFRVGAIMSAGHPLAKCASVGFRDCARYPLILANPSLALRALMEPLLTTLPAPTSLQLHTDSIELMRQLAIRGLGVAFHTRVGLDSLLAAGRLVYKSLRGNAPKANLGIYVRAERVLPPAVDLCAALLGEALQRLSKQEGATRGGAGKAG